MRTILATLLMLAMAGFAQAEEPALKWYKGNTHTHTNRSDGDSSPSVVAKWYLDHNYNFLVISDHNVVTDPGELAELETESFLLIPGEEISASHNRAPIHIVGMNVDHVVKPIKDQETVAATIQANVDAIIAAKGIPHINHPNFYWAISHLDLLKVKNYRLLEIYNGHPLVNNLGGSGHPGMDEIWDYLLTNDQKIFGIAVDDAHHFQGEFAATRSNPGRGWLMVKANALTTEAILGAIESGNFYASSGVVLDDVVITPQKYEITIRQEKNHGYRVEFIGADGKILKEVEESPAVYEIKGTEKYVRAKVYDSNGAIAWTQPNFH